MLHGADVTNPSHHNYTVYIHPAKHDVKLTLYLPPGPGVVCAPHPCVRSAVARSQNIEPVMTAAIVSAAECDLVKLVLSGNFIALSF